MRVLRPAAILRAGLSADCHVQWRQQFVATIKLRIVEDAPRLVRGHETTPRGRAERLILFGERSAQLRVNIRFDVGVRLAERVWQQQIERLFECHDVRHQFHIPHLLLEGSDVGIRAAAEA